MASRRTAENADTIQREQAGQWGVIGYRIDGTTDLGRPFDPAGRSGSGVVQIVVTTVLRHGNYKAALHESTGQVGVHPR